MKIVPSLHIKSTENSCTMKVGRQYLLEQRPVDTKQIKEDEKLRCIVRRKLQAQEDFNEKPVEKRIYVKADARRTPIVSKVKK